VNIARSETLTHWQEHSAGVQIQTRQRSCVTGVLIQAEGGLAQDHADELTLYQQTALVTEVSAARPQAQTAFERFTRDGPLALLPVAHSAPGAYAVVWCMRPAQAERRMKLKADELALELQQAMGQRLGALTLLGPSQSYPLGLKRQSASGVRHMRIGNAAQILHPVAGQGLNLGLRDAYCLAQIWNEAHGWPLPLRHHARQRQPDRLILTVLTDVLARAFTWPVLPVAGAGLMALDLCPPARRALAHTLIFGWR
jgi:2-octaprenyl-6-methoxyphenol hydroxylase